MYLNLMCSFATGKPLIMIQFSVYYKSIDLPNIIQSDKGSPNLSFQNYFKEVEINSRSSKKKLDERYKAIKGTGLLPKLHSILPRSSLLTIFYTTLSRL